MAAKLLLSISNDQATAAVWRGRRLDSCKRFENNPAGWTAFGSFLRDVRGLPVHIIVDTVEEDFRFETLPHIRGGDRTAMVNRKLKQLYRATPYYSYALLERETGRRRDDRYLFAALTSADLLVPWLRAIETAALPVSGIYPQALVSVSLIERLNLSDPNLLIITKNSAGLRQTFFKNLKFRISRLTPLGGTEATSDEVYADEVANTRMYLDALTVTHVDDILEVVILDQDGSLANLSAAIMRERPNSRCQYLTISDIHARFGIPIADLEASADVLHLHLLGEKAPALNLAPADLTRTYQRFAVGRWVYAASGLTLLGAVLWSGVNVYRALAIDRNAETAQRQTLDYRAKYQLVAEGFPDTPTTPDNLRHTVEIAEQISAAKRTPEKMFSIVSHALDASPAIQLKRIEWHYGDAIELKPGKKPAQTLPSELGNLIQTGVVYGEITESGSDYRAALSTIDAFSQRLAQDEAVSEVNVLKLPLDVRSEAALNGTTSSVAGKQTAKFEIAVVFKNGA
jgi:hypothetical protein